MSNKGRRLLIVGLLTLLVIFSGCASNASRPAEGGNSGVDRGSGGDIADFGSYFRADGTPVLIREASMTLEVKEFKPAFREARSAAISHGGYVGDRSLQAEGNWERSEMTIKVPAENFTEVRDALSELGKIESESVSIKDFTNEYQERESKLASLQDREQELEAQLDETNDSDERDQIESELETVREQIANLESEQTTLKRRAAMSTIHVTMAEPISQKPPKNYERAFGFKDAFLEAFYGGLDIFKGVIMMIGFGISLGLSALVLGLFGLVGFYGGRFAFLRANKWLKGIFGDPERGPIDQEPGP